MVEGFQIKIALTLLLGFPLLLFGQSPKEWFQQANDDFMYGKYDDAWEKLEKAEQLLGKTNPRIQSVKSQIAYNRGDAVAAKVEIEKYFKLTSPKYYNTSGHQAMVLLRESINGALETEEKSFEEEKKAIAKKGMEEAEALEKKSETKLAEKAEAFKAKEEKNFYEKVNDSKDKQALETYMKYFGSSSKASTVKTELKKFTSPDEFLYTAVESNDLTEAKHLLVNGGNANLYLKSEYLMHTATKSASLDMMKLLKEYGGSFEKSDGKGYTSIAWAVIKASREKVEYLMEKGANLEAKSGLGYTPYLLAAYNGNTELLDVLKSGGANISEVNGKSQGALEICYSRDLISTFQYLLGDLSANTIFSNKYSGIYNAVADKKHNFLEALLKAGGSTNTEQRNGWYALHYATYLGDSRATQLLLQYNANPNLEGEYRWTALHYAAREGNATIAQQLMQNGADVRLKDMYRRTPKRVAREHKNQYVFK